MKTLAKRIRKDRQETGAARFIGEKDAFDNRMVKCYGCGSCSPCLGNQGWADDLCGETAST